MLVSQPSRCMLFAACGTADVIQERSTGLNPSLFVSRSLPFRWRRQYYRCCTLSISLHLLHLTSCLVKARMKRANSSDNGAKEASATTLESRFAQAQARSSPRQEKLLKTSANRLMTIFSSPGSSIKGVKHTPRSRVSHSSIRGRPRRSRLR